MDHEAQTIRLVFTAGSNLNYKKRRRLELTQEEIRYFQTYKNEFPSNNNNVKRIVKDAKPAIHAARRKRNELLALAAATESLSVAAGTRVEDDGGSNLKHPQATSDASARNK